MTEAGDRKGNMEGSPWGQPWSSKWMLFTEHQMQKVDREGKIEVQLCVQFEVHQIVPTYGRALAGQTTLWTNEFRQRDLLE